MRYKKIEKRTDPANVKIEITCGSCGWIDDLDSIQKLSMEITGGCRGHESGEYCYCNPQELTVEHKCTKCKKDNYLMFEDLVY